MTVSKHDSTFAGRPIEQFSGAIQNPDAAIRVSVEYDQWEDGTRVADLIDALSKDPQASRVRALVIGPWDYESDESAVTPIYEKLCEPAVVEKLRGLTALFLGDITYEEQEISWIGQGDVDPIVRAYPSLEVLRVRGGNGLSLGALDAPALTTLIVEAGGLPGAVLSQVCGARLPNLEHLELWLGSENYGSDHTVDDLMPILSGRLFPKLRYLGLRDCEYTDDVARALAEAPVLSQLETLDLSMGTFGDDGANALLASAQVKKLRKLDVSHHYMTPEVAEQLAALGPEVVANDPQGPDEDRYIQVSE
jgi:hypothetical protein